MKKVAIMTINSINFGNRLQNYALQKIVSELGFQVETIKRLNHDLWINHGVNEKVKDLLRIIIGTRKGLYLRFEKKYIKYSKYYALPNKVDNKLEREFDYFISGSDQVWNPYYEHIVGESDLLLFTSRNKKISYAASFGTDRIPDEKKELYQEALGDFKVISVRENAGAEIVRNLIKGEVEVVLDPTLLLSSDQWRKLRRKPKYVPNGKYALVYILGEQSVECTQYINELKEKYGFRIYDILAKNEYGKEPAIGPSEFLYLIEYAEIVISDSFHATVFSILFHKKVRTYNRKGINMSCRIVTLAERLMIEHCLNNEGIFFADCNIDFKAIDELLEFERKKSIDFLLKAFG